MQGFDFIKRGWLAETFTSTLLGTNQPWGELLDSCPVLGPEFDIIGILVTLNSCIILKISDVLGDTCKLILECLGISRDLFT